MLEVLIWELTSCWMSVTVQRCVRSLALRSAPLLHPCPDLMTSSFSNNKQIATSTQKTMPTYCLLQEAKHPAGYAQARRVCIVASAGAAPTPAPHSILPAAAHSDTRKFRPPIYGKHELSKLRMQPPMFDVCDPTPMRWHNAAPSSALCY